MRGSPFGDQPANVNLALTKAKQNLTTARHCGGPGVNLLRCESPMYLRSLLPAGTAAALLLALPGPARSGGLGLEFLHGKVLISGHVCMADHTHTGKGGAADPVSAQRQAIKDWSEFTAFEYGDAWGHYGIAGHKQVRCGQLRGAWMCEVEAVPCRL